MYNFQIKAPVVKIILLIFIPVFSFSQGIIFFEGTWKEALEKAKKEDKIVFVDSYTTWCGPCIKMAKNVFTQESVGKFFNENFINIKLDMEKEDGVSFGHKYPVKAYPTLHFIDGDGKVVKKVQGGQQADGLIALGEAALKNNDKSGKYAEEYEAGNRDYQLVLSYVKALNNAGKPSLKISNDYLNSNPAISEEQKLQFVFEAVVDADSRLFETMVSQSDKIIPLVGKDTYLKKIKKTCDNTVEKAIQFEMYSLVEEASKKMKTHHPDEAEAFAHKASYKYTRAFRDEKGFIKAYRGMVKNDAKNPDILYGVSKDIINSFPENQEMLKDAASYAEKFYEIKNDNEALNYLCHVLMVQGDIKTALKHVNAKKDEVQKKGEDTGFYDNMIKFLEGKKV
jgi:thiol-disulfide isomerase/thioredoxin